MKIFQWNLDNWMGLAQQNNSTFSCKLIRRSIRALIEENWQLQSAPSSGAAVLWSFAAERLIGSDQSQKIFDWACWEPWNCGHVVSFSIETNELLTINGPFCWQVPHGPRWRLRAAVWCCLWWWPDPGWWRTESTFRWSTSSCKLWNKWKVVLGVTWSRIDKGPRK